MSMDNGDATDTGPLTMSEAVKAFTASPAEPASDEEHAGDEVAQEGDAAEDELLTAEEGEDEGETVDEEEQPDAEDGDEDETEEQPEAGQGRFVADDARVKLEDGTFVTVADLKAGALRRDDYTRKTQETAAEKQQTVAERTQLTQLREANEQVRDYTISVLEQFMPTKPDDAMYATDFIRATQMEREFNQRQEQLQYLKAQREWDQQQVTTQRAQESHERANTEWAKLIAHKDMPELKDEARGKALISELLTYGKQQGYEEQEVRGALAFDHRQAVILKKAMAYDKLQAAKAKVPAKIEGRPPVQRSSKRLNANGLANRDARNAMTALNETGSLKDGVRAYLASQKKG